MLAVLLLGSRSIGVTRWIQTVQAQKLEPKRKLSSPAAADAAAAGAPLSAGMALTATAPGIAARGGVSVAWICASSHPCYTMAMQASLYAL